MEALLELVLQSPVWLFENIASGNIPKKSLFFVFGLVIPAAVVGFLFGSYTKSIFGQLIIACLTGMLGFEIATGGIYLYYFIKNPPPEYKEIAASNRSLFSDPKKGLLFVLGIAILSSLCVFYSMGNSLVVSLICGGLVFIFGAVAARAYFKS